MASFCRRATSGLFIAAALVALLATGCGQDDDGASADTAGGQDTAGQLSDASSPADTTAATDAMTATDANGAQDASAKPDAANASDINVEADTGAKPDVPPSKLRWFQTCGDPVCSGWKSKPNVPLCTGEKANDPCASPEGTCDPKDGCNAVLICAEKDPKAGPGGCPISARRFKKGIVYLDHAAESGLRDALLQLPLATWQYRNTNRNRRSLGYILEDAPRMPASDMGRERVDVYALSTMTVAAIKAQQRELRALRVELAALRARCKGMK